MAPKNLEGFKWDVFVPQADNLPVKTFLGPINTKEKEREERFIKNYDLTIAKLRHEINLKNQL